MKQSKALLTICLVVVLVFSSAAIFQRQKEASTLQISYDLLACPVTLNYASSFAERALPPENTTRAGIYSFIQANPGVQFRAICSGLGLSVGVVQFHIAVLEKNGFINALFKGRYKRFFIAGKFSRKEMETIATLKLETVRNILKSLLERKHLAHHELATKLCVTSQGLTWQMSRLQQTGLIEKNRNGLNVSYSINAAHALLIAQTIAFIENPSLK